MIEYPYYIIDKNINLNSIFSVYNSAWCFTLIKDRNKIFKHNIFYPVSHKYFIFIDPDYRCKYYNYNNLYKEVKKVIFNQDSLKKLDNNNWCIIEGKKENNYIIKESNIPYSKVKLWQFKEAYIYSEVNEVNVNLYSTPDRKLYLPYINCLHLGAGNPSPTLKPDFFKDINKDASIHIRNINLDGDYSFNTLQFHKSNISGNYSIKGTLTLNNCNTNINNLVCSTLYFRKTDTKTNNQNIQFNINSCICNYISTTITDGTQIYFKSLKTHKIYTNSWGHKNHINILIDNLYLDKKLLLDLRNSCYGQIIVNKVHITKPTNIRILGAGNCSVNIKECNTGNPIKVKGKKLIELS